MTTQPFLQDKVHWRTLFAFIVPSLIGVFLFMTPVSVGEAMTIPIAVLAKQLQAFVAPFIHAMIVGSVCVTAVFSLMTKLLKPKSLMRSTLFKHLFDVSWIWLITRLLGTVFILMTFFKVGPSFIHAEHTGALVLNDLLPVLFSVFVLAGLLLPLLLNFGLLALVGTLLTKVMRPLFGVPGRSAVNCVASWLGDGSVGILMTARQYEEKYYTQKEAAVIGTTFSAVSITFCLVVIGQVKLEHLFAPFYLTV